MSFLIVTGMSGAGKSVVIKHLEDMDYFCIDNLPPQLIPKFAEMCFHSHNQIERAAVVVDMRGGELFFNELFTALEEMRKNQYQYEILFIDASDEVLSKRYKETRRAHPLMKEGTVYDGILNERRQLKKIKSMSDHVVDTTNLLPKNLKEVLNQILSVRGGGGANLLIDIVSFGFKYGAPTSLDLMFDVRFLPNPFYIEDLKPHNGKNEPVKDYIFSFEQTNIFIAKLFDLLSFLIPHYIDEGKTQLIIGIGCTGGKHRSVAIAEELFAMLRKAGYRTIIQHNDIGRE